MLANVDAWPALWRRESNQHSHVIRPLGASSIHGPIATPADNTFERQFASSADSVADVIGSGIAVMLVQVDADPCQ